MVDPVACSLLLSGDVRSYVVVGRGHVAGLLLVHGRAFCAVDVPVEVLVAQLLSCHPMESQRSVSRLATDLCAGFRVLGAFSINRCRSARDRKLELRNRGQPSVAFGTASAPNPAPTALNGPPPPDPPLPSEQKESEAWRCRELRTRWKVAKGDLGAKFAQSFVQKRHPKALRARNAVRRETGGSVCLPPEVCQEMAKAGALAEGCADFSRLSWAFPVGGGGCGRSGSQPGPGGCEEAGGIREFELDERHASHASCGICRISRKSCLALPRARHRAARASRRVRLSAAVL